MFFGVVSETHSLSEVTETAELLSQLQLGSQTNPPREQYAIIDTNQLLEHLDAVNSMLEHVVACLSHFDWKCIVLFGTTEYSRMIV